MRTFHAGSRAILLAFTVLAGCGEGSADYPTAPNGAPVVTTVGIQLDANRIEVGESDSVVAFTFDQNGEPIASGPITYSSSNQAVAVVHSTTGAILSISAGTTIITATADGKSADRVITVFASPIRLNEIKPNGNGPGGWIELYNPSTSDIELSNWTITAQDLAASFTIPAGSVIPSHAYFVIDEANFPNGLNAADAIHLFSGFGVQVDAFTWATDPVKSYGRCPDGAGDFVVNTAATRGAVNTCPQVVIAAQGNGRIHAAH